MLDVGRGEVVDPVVLHPGLDVYRVPPEGDSPGPGELGFDICGGDVDGPGHREDVDSDIVRLGDDEDHPDDDEDSDGDEDHPGVAEVFEPWSLTGK